MRLKTDLIVPKNKKIYFFPKDIKWGMVAAQHHSIIFVEKERNGRENKMMERTREIFIPNAF